MNSVIFSSGQRIIKQILDWLQAGNQSGIKARTTDYKQPGVVFGELNGMSVIPGTNNTLATPSVTVRTGIAYDVNGERINISSESVSFDPSLPLHTTDNGLGTPILTPRSTGSLNIPLVANSDNYVWIEYLATTDDSLFTLQKISNAKQFYKQTDGYKISTTIVNTPPTGLSVLLARINLVGSGEVNTSTINTTVRSFSKIKDYRVRITTNRTDRTDVPPVYATGEIELFLDDHIKAVGNGPVTPTNPHGLTAIDIGLTATTIEEHQLYMHTKGIVGDSASIISSLYPFITNVDPGMDFITVRKIIFGEQAVVNGLTINSANLGSDSIVNFNPLDGNGDWYVYLDSVTKTILKTQVNLIASPDTTKLVICKVTWTYPGEEGVTDGDLTDFSDLRVFGNIATREIQGEAVTPGKIDQTFNTDFTFPIVDTTAYHAFLISQGVEYRSILGGSVGNSYSVTVIDSGLGGLAYIESAGALTIDLGGATPSTKEVVELIGTTTPSAFVTVRRTGSNYVVIQSVQPLTGGSSGKVKENGISLLPAGVILPFGNNASPAGFLPCDGTAVSRLIYSSLFSAIGIGWGQGDGTNTFNLPDLRGRFIRGRDAGTGRDPNAGSRTASNSGGNTGDNVGTLQTQGTKLPTTPFAISGSGSGSMTGSTDNSGAHQHSYAVLARVGGNQTGSNWVPWVPAYDALYNTGNSPSNVFSGSNQGSHSHSVSVSGPVTITGTVSGGDNETRPINASVAFIIKY